MRHTGDMDHFRLKKYRGPETWARVRIAYEAGESGPSVARRFDVGLANLRKKARIEGWCRRAQARRADAELAGTPVAARRPEGAAEAPPPADPVQALGVALSRASAALAAGRAGEATALIRAAEALARLTGARPGAEPEPPAAQPVWEADLRQAHDEMQREIERRAGQLARDLLGDVGNAPAVHGAFVYRWRARVFGPDCAAADRQHAETGGWAGRYWREDGSLRPPGEVRDGIWSVMRHRIRAEAGLPFAGDAPGD